MWPQQRYVTFQATAVVPTVALSFGIRNKLQQNEVAGKNWNARKYERKLHRHEVALLCGPLCVAINKAVHGGVDI
jgi:hypothetical protein